MSSLCSKSAPVNVVFATGAAMGHAGEYLQGVIEEGGECHAVLISIPTPELGSRAHFEPDRSGMLAGHPSWKQKSRRAFELAWESFCDLPASGRLHIESDLPVSRGMGSSTADCVAAIRAAALSLGRPLSSHQIARLAHKAEQNSDATMYGSRLVLFRHREGRVHRLLPGNTPPFDLVIVESANGARRVDTDTLQRPRYSPAEVAEFNELFERFRQASATSALAGIAGVAERSADINQRYHPMPGLLETRAIARGFGACGTAIAHSGDIQVILFAPRTLNDDLQLNLERELARAGMVIWRTLTGRERVIESASSPS
jgi:uncharacterized protein involved in propanediol utilization